MWERGSILIRAGVEPEDRPRRAGVGRGSRFRVGRAFVALAVCALALSCAVAPASAKVVHPLVSTFTGSDAPGGPLGGLVVGAAVDQSNGDVYALESNFAGLGTGVVDKFDENGVYAGVQITGAETPGGEPFAFGLVAGVAVDNSLGLTAGDVYVADTEHHVVDRFSPSGVYECQIVGAETVSPSECHSRR